MENKEPTFEEALARLVEIVRALESGQKNFPCKKSGAFFGERL